MARLRKASRLWQNADSRAAANTVMIGDDGVEWRIDPPVLFGRRAPLEVELGAGRGDFLMERAAANPDRDFIAVELATTVARLMAVRAGRRELANLRVACADVRTLVNLLIPDGAVSAYHVYFPDPWPKARHQKHRMFSPALVAGIIRTLSDGGVVHVASDVRAWADEMFAMMMDGGFVATTGRLVATAGADRSGFGRKYRAAGRPFFGLSFIRNDSASLHDSDVYER